METSLTPRGGKKEGPRLFDRLRSTPENVTRPAAQSLHKRSVPDAVQVGLKNTTKKVLKKVSHSTKVQCE
ncbi:hypothetical protein F1880_002762 [Penicillium rolfsii]|nr:hypothetical protein F1880_002762 [Penicillium rolfsii]